MQKPGFPRKSRGFRAYDPSEIGLRRGYGRAKNGPPAKRGLPGFGDVWTWTAIDGDSKLLISYMVGARDGETACAFVADLAGRLANRVQLTTGGHKAYLEAVEQGFGGEIDYAKLVKNYESQAGNGSDVRYRPGDHVETRSEVVACDPEWEHVSASFGERRTLATRIRGRRFARLTNAFSRKIENHEHAIAIDAIRYNFVRRHQTLGMTPAMKAGVSRKLWTLEDMVGLLD